jgi:hypothetical protein
MEMLNTLVDESDPDTSVGQIEHLLQTAEAIRRDGKPDWMQVTGLIHDLGKLMCFFGAEGQWDVVGDTFVVGCKFPKEIIYPETFKENPDYYDPKLSTEYGIYEPNCGLDNVMISFGHDGEWSRVKSIPSFGVARGNWQSGIDTDTDADVRIHVQHLQEPEHSPSRSTRHAPLPLVLSMAPRGRLPPPHERRRPRGPQGGQGVQPL